MQYLENNSKESKKLFSVKRLQFPNDRCPRINHSKWNFGGKWRQYLGTYFQHRWIIDISLFLRSVVTCFRNWIILIDWVWPFILLNPASLHNLLYSRTKVFSMGKKKRKEVQYLLKYQLSSSHISFHHKFVKKNPAETGIAHLPKFTANSLGKLQFRKRNC